MADTAKPDASWALDAADTPEAYERLSWAAWWRDDAQAVFDARGQAYRRYREAGDAAGAARMATWLACDELDFNGAFAVAGGWLSRAHRLLDGLGELPEHGWLSFFEGYVASAGGETDRTLELARATHAVGRRLAIPDLEMLGLALEGATLVGCAEVVEGMRRLDEATVTALEEEATIPIAGAWACCFLVAACAAARDYERAFEWCDRIAEFAERYGSRYMLGFCRAEYGAVHLWRGRWAEAEAMLEASIDDLQRSRPATAGGAIAGLAELRRRQGRTEEAAALLNRVAALRPAQLCAARQALDRGDTREAVELLERLLRQVPEERRLQRAPALELLIRAHAARCELVEARAALVELEEIELLVGTSAMQAARELAQGRVAAASGDHEHAKARLEDAVDGFDLCGAPFEAAEARTELAATLLALGRADAADREASLAHDAVLRLRAGCDQAASPLPELTPRERDVLELVADGLTNQQIAERLTLSEHTVHRHVTNILRKLGLPSRAAAAAHAVRSGVAP